MDFEDLLAPPGNSILLRVVPSTATTAGGKLVIPDKGVLSFLKDVTLASTSRKDLGEEMMDMVDARGGDIAELLEKSPGSTGIIVASSYGLSLLLHEDEEGGAVVGNGDVVKLSHGCLLVLIETRNDPSLFNVPDFVQRLQHISGDANLTLKEPPKILYQECEGNFVTAPLKDRNARQILVALEKIDVAFFTNESRSAQIVDTIKKNAIGWVVWPRILLYLILDSCNESKWAKVLHRLMPSLPVEERSLVSRILENMKAKFGDFTPKAETLSVGITGTQMMLIQPLISTILCGQILPPLVMLSMSNILFKRANLAATKYANSTCPSRRIPKLSLQTTQRQVDLTIFSKPRGATSWVSHTCSQGGRVVVKPHTHVNFQIGNRASRPVCWQLWNLPSNPAEQPALLLPYSDPSSVANLTMAGMKWPSLANTRTNSEERQISFEMSDEGLETVILFAWWRLDNSEIQYERVEHKILVAA